MSHRVEKLFHYLDQALQLNAEAVYLAAGKSSYTYQHVFSLSNTLAEKLESIKFIKGDRVVIYSSKNAASVALMNSVNRKDGVYVPVSSLNPAGRAAYIIRETAPAVVACDASCYESLQKEMTLNEFARVDELILAKTQAYETIEPPENAAFILFTSGSTGTPKGVVITDEAAMAFIDWSVKTFGFTPADKLASIAPFNFDLSVLDIYASAKAGAALRLYTEDETKNALLMAQLLSQDGVTAVYATPTFYATLAHYGKMHKYQYDTLRIVLFAGEVFLPENFRLLLQHWPGLNYFNLYGPTETNVCTWYNATGKEIPETAFPIGIPCEYDEIMLVDENDTVVKNEGEEGELLVTGASLFTCYWKDAEKTTGSIFTDEDGRKWYRTGDIVSMIKGELVYRSRRDRMIKKHGFRIEPTEIEKAVATFPGISNAAVIFSKQHQQLVCFVESENNPEANTLSLKSYCQKFLPGYMIPDKFVILEALPKTTSGKIDLQALTQLL